MGGPGAEAVGFQSFRMRVSYRMGNRLLWEIKCLHGIGAPGFERIKVAARNLFHPTASTPDRKVGFFKL
jgi:hypothetical protein